MRSSRQPAVEMPTSRDPSLWMVRCKSGSENEAAVQLMRKWFESRDKGAPLQIFSVVSNPTPRSLLGKSYIYVEAFKEMHVKEAVKGLEALQFGQWKQDMVPTRNMPEILRVVRPKLNIVLKGWVRLRTGVYRGDLGQVIKIYDTKNQADVRVVPRLDLNKLLNKEAGREKRKRNWRPPPRLFDPTAFE